MRVDIWSDLVCPWCYLGKRRFERALAMSGQQDDVQVVHRSFQLDPSFPKGQSVAARTMLMQKYRMSDADVAASQDRLERLAAAEGLEYHLTESHTGNTMDAILECVRAYATVGEMCDALRDVWGEYEEVPII